MGRSRLFLAAVAVALLSLPAAALADAGYTTSDVHLRAGPGTGYPVVTTIPDNRRVNIHGCLGDYNWCDVSWADTRGWVAADYLNYLYNGSYVYLPDYVDVIDVPVVTFSLGTYWAHYYPHRPWYHHRAHWARYWRAHRHEHRNVRRAIRHDRQQARHERRQLQRVIRHEHRQAQHANRQDRRQARHAQQRLQQRALRHQQRQARHAQAAGHNRAVHRRAAAARRSTVGVARPARQAAHAAHRMRLGHVGGRPQARGRAAHFGGHRAAGRRAFGMAPAARGGGHPHMGGGHRGGGHAAPHARAAHGGGHGHGRHR
jgi:uncharacterized protein YraI